MTEVNGSNPAWREGVESVMGDSEGVGMKYYYNSGGAAAAVNGGAAAAVTGDVTWKVYAVEFARGVGEMSVQFGKGVRDVIKQSSIFDEDSVIVRRFGGPCQKLCSHLRFLNDYLPEDRDPVHVWSVILSVLFIAFAVLLVNTDHETAPLVNKVRTHPPSASLILLPDGRHLAYMERGVPADQARFTVIAPHSFLSSRLAGMPGIKHSLLQEFGVRLVTYDLPGFGESDPHPNRNLESSALDMLHLSYAVNVIDKFWVLGYSAGSMHAWAALRYIPDRVAGVIMLAPVINPYEPSLSKEERRRIWGKWTSKKKMMYYLARKFPRLLPYFYRRSFLSGNHGQIDKWLSLSLGKRDRALVEGHLFEEFWQRDLEESIRQGNVKPFVDEAVLQVSNWGFTISDLKVQKKRRGKGILNWFKSIFGETEEFLSGFLGPIHIWQGMDDKVAPPATSDFLQRVLPDVVVNKLLYEGHFSFFFFCDECHRQIFSSVYGAPQGPLAPDVDQSPCTIKDDKFQTPIKADKESTEPFLSELASETENSCSVV